MMHTMQIVGDGFDRTHMVCYAFHKIALKIRSNPRMKLCPIS
jgi:hypothetical protein